MAGTYNILYGVLLSTVFPIFLQAQISFPLGGVTYWQPGSLVKLPWTYNIPTANILVVEISFMKSGSNISATLADGFRGASPKSLHPRNFTIEGQATLVFKNASLGHNGTYSLAVSLRGATLQKSEVLVVILVQPTANVNCSSLVTLKEEDDFNCSCEGTGGNPPAIASWYKGNVSISGPGYLQEILSLKNVSRNTVGNYSCFVKSYNLTDGKQVEIQVLHKPQITSFNSDQKNNISPVGKTVTITCVAEAFPAPDYIIFHNGMKLTDVVNGVKTIQSANLNHDGRYECVANNTIGNVRATFNLTVNVQPTANVDCSSLVTLKEGDDFTCSCEGTGGNPPAFASWYKGNVRFSGPGYLQEALSFKNVSRKTDGNYSCFVKSYNLTDSKQVEIQVLLKPTAVTNCSTNVTVKEEDNVECLCYGTGGNPRPTASWYKDGRKVSGPEYLRKTLSLKNISKEDAGNYSCIVSNSAFEDVKQVQIHVLHKPEINYFGSDQKNDMAIVGERVRITCKADGFPPPEYKIFHNSTKLTDVNDGVKTIVSANYNDSGQYKCIAKNSRGNKSEIFNLTVKELKRPNASVNCSSLVTKNRGDEFACLCVGKGGYPPPIASWFKDGKNVSGRGYLNKALSLKNISKNDKGTYSCVVDSHGLNDTQEIEIQVQYKPESISFESNGANNMATVGDSITFTCKADAFPSPNYTILHNSTNLKDVLNGVKTFKSVKLSDNGSYICTAKNVLGNASKDFNLTVKVSTSTTKVFTEDDGLSKGAVAGIAVGCGLLFILLVVLICCCCKHDKCDRYKKERNESEVVLADGGIPNVAVAVEEGFNAYEPVDKEKIKPNVEAGTSGDGEPARVDSPPSMPPVYAVVDKKSIKKKTPPDEEKPASGEDDNAAPAAAPSTLYAAVDKGAQQKERDAKPDSLTYASLDPVLLQPDSSKMRDRSHEETNYATIDMEKLHRDKT